MANCWSPFYWADYIADTGHLSIIQHGAYLLLMGHYYRTGQPIPSDLSQLYRICRAFKKEEQAAVRSVLEMFFFLDGQMYRQKRIDAEITKQQIISARYKIRAKTAAAVRWAASNDSHLESQNEKNPSPARAFVCPSVEEVKAYCQQRGNHIDAQHWMDYYQANGWKVGGRNSMKDWKAVVRYWERNGFPNGSQPGCEKPVSALEQHRKSLGITGS